MVGALDGRDGSLWLLYRQDGLGVSLVHFPQVPRMEGIAFAGDGKVAFVLKPEEEGDEGVSRVVRCASYEAFWEWMEDGAEGGVERFEVPGRVRRLVGDGAGNFFLLMEGGEVYCLGELGAHDPGCSGSADAPAESRKPGLHLVSALSKKGIRKIACGGQLCAALSEKGTLYTWKTANPANDRTIKPLREADVGEVVQVQLPDAEWALDVLDVGVGDNHTAVLDEGHKVWVIGDNSRGQLGLDSEEPFFDDWTQVPSLNDVQEIQCGPHATFAFTTNGPALP